jgi:hypothetical protein
VKRADITVGKTYAAKVDWRRGVVVRVIEFDIAQRHGNETRKTGVKVENIEPFRTYGGEQPPGTTFVITTRDIEKEWTEEDQRKRDERARMEADLARRGSAIQEVLAARGIEALAHRGQFRLTFEQVEKLLAIPSEGDCA